MKKILAVVLSAVMAFAIVSCSEPLDENVKPDTNLTVNEIEEKCKDYVYCLTVALDYEWDENKDSSLYNYNNGLYFTEVLQSLYRYDNDKEIYNEEGYAHIDDLIDICSKHFPVSAEATRQLFVKMASYDNTTNLVAMAGIGSIKLAVTDDIVIDGNKIEILYSVGDETYDKNSDTYVPANPVKGLLTVEIKDDSFVFLSNKHLARPLYEETTHPYPQQYKAEKLTETLVYSMDKSAFEENRAEFSSAGNYKGENFKFDVEDSGLNCSVSFDLYEAQTVNSGCEYVYIGQYRFDYTLLIEKNCWQFVGFEKI